VDEQDRRAAIALYDRFTHEGMDRRAFMAELTRIAGGAAAATALLGSIAAQAHAAPRIREDDPRIYTDTLRIVRDGRPSAYYLAQPIAAAEGKARAKTIIVIHENRGLNPHIKDVARRFAVAGYRALAPDFLAPLGETPPDEDRARTMIGQLDLAAATRDGVTLVREAAGPRNRPRPVGIVGFCWGGAMVHRIALAAGDTLAAGVSFYGPAPDPGEAAKLTSPLLVILAARDERVNGTALPYVAAAEAAGRPIRAITYPDVDHAFHNDTSAARYNRHAAGEAWAETMRHFYQHLR
jgi:carboxymethylenebutenolidase